jgi:hypothetical protein
MFADNHPDCGLLQMGAAQRSRIKTTLKNNLKFECPSCRRLLLPRLEAATHTAASAAGQVRVAPSSFTVWRAFPFLLSVSSLLTWQFLPNSQVSNLERYELHSRSH